MKCASVGCENNRVKGRRVCNPCKDSRANSPKIVCATDGCKTLAAMDSHICRFCSNREQAMSEAKEPNTTGMKVCCRCKESLPVSQFSVNRNNPDALDYTDKVCRAKRKAKKMGSRKEKSMLEEEMFGGLRWHGLLSKPLPKGDAPWKSME